MGINLPEQNSRYLATDVEYQGSVESSGKIKQSRCDETGKKHAKIQGEMSEREYDGCQINRENGVYFFE